jgi:hydroxyethylthiazole kinase-like uncharacterized protein yjeF
MLKLFSTKQIKELDAYTIAHEPVSSIDLMERACRAFVVWFTEKFNASTNIGVVCGTGNNGGDGLAIARMLKEWGYPVKVWVVKGPVSESDDFKVNEVRLNGKVSKQEITFKPDKSVFQDRQILIDAIFGSGLSRPVQGIYAEVIECINETDAVRIAVDIPSGLMADSWSEGSIVRATYTLSFQLPKLAFLMPENHPYVGTWCLADIKLDKEFIKRTDTSNFLLQRKDIKKLQKTRSKFDHKGTFGKALLVAGSYGKMGAAILAAKAALRSGVGLLTVHIPVNGYNIVQTAVPEAMVEVDIHQNYLTSAPDTNYFNAIGIGPGIGQHRDTIKAFGDFLEKNKKPLVIDADGLNILAANREFLHLLPKACILTPHLKEFERLVGPSKNDFDRLERLKKFSGETDCIVVLKGAYSAICSPEGKLYFNSTGNPGMATGGTGDVLTGILTGVLAQGYPSLEAAMYGVFLHGLAGDKAAHEKSQEALIASDVVDFLPQAFKHLCQ